MQEKRWLTLIFSLYFMLAGAYSWGVPPWEGPDEPAHYILAVNLARVGKFSSIQRNYEAGQPQPYYWLASVPLKVLYEINPAWVEVVYPERDYGNVRQSAPIFFWSADNYLFLPGLYLLRWLNILLGAGALGLNYAAMKRFTHPDLSPLPLTALALGALAPQFLHTTATVANDTLGILAGASLFWLMAKIMSENISPRWLGMAVGLGILLPVMTKLTALPIGLVLIGGVALNARQRWPLHWKRLVGVGALLGVGSVLLLALLLPTTGMLLWRQIQLRVFSVSPEALSLDYLWEMVSQVVWSYWGKVGWLAVGLPGWVIAGLTGLGLLGAGMDVRRCWGENDTREGVTRWADWLVIVAAGLTGLAVLKNGLNTVNSQGRYLFPTLGPLTLIMVRGWEGLLPARWRRYLLPGIIGLMLGINVMLWMGGIIPVYYQPGLD